MTLIIISSLDDEKNYNFLHSIRMEYGPKKKTYEFALLSFGDKKRCFFIINAVDTNTIFPSVFFLLCLRAWIFFHSS